MSNMTENSIQAREVKAAIDQLIHEVSAKQYAILQRIYHDNMRIYMLNGEQIQPIDKASFIAHITQVTDSLATPNIWAKYHLVEADEHHGHVLISRKVNLTGEEQLISLSIDLVFEDNRWQITREVIFVEQPS